MGNSKKNKEGLEEKERREHIAGYDRRFDPVAEAYDLLVARVHRRERRRKV